MCSKSILLPINPFSNVPAAIRPFEYSKTVSFTIFEYACKYYSIGPPYLAFAVETIAWPVAWVRRPIFSLKGAITLNPIFYPATNEDWAIWELVLPVSMLLITNEVTFVFIVVLSSRKNN